MRVLAERQLIAPDGISGDKRQIPLDFTSLSSQEIGRQQGDWAARLAYGLFEVGKVAAELGNLRYDIKVQQRLWRPRKTNYDTIKDMEAAMFEDETVSEIERRIVQAETALQLIEAVVKGYEVLQKACSREITRRQGEMQSQA